MAVSADGECWFLLNASPEIRHQIENFSGLHPRAPRHSPIDAIVARDPAGAEAAMHEHLRDVITQISSFTKPHAAAAVLSDPDLHPPSCEESSLRSH